MFAYCGNNPVSRNDEGGEFWNIVAGALIGAAISAATQIVSNIVCGEENWYDGVLLAAATGAASGALSATGLGVVAQVVGNAAIAFAGETINQGLSGNLDSLDGWVSIGISTISGGIGGAIGGNGMRHKSGNYYKAAQQAKDTAMRVFSKQYSNPSTPGRLISRAANMVKAVGRHDSLITGIKFGIGAINSQILTKGGNAIYQGIKAKFTQGYGAV